MNTNSARERIQEKLETLTRRWWLYPLLLLLMLVPSYAAKGYDPRATTDLVTAVLAKPLITSFPFLFPIAKVIPVLLIMGLFVFGNRLRSVFAGYATLLYVALALFQTTAVTEQYGFAVISGNVVLVLIVALLWGWELIAARNDFAPCRRPLWAWWVVPVAAFSLLAPINPSTMTPDFRPLTLLANEAGLTYCMMTPVFLAVLTLWYPRVNLALLRVASFVGIYFAAMNMLTWFVLNPWAWWMGVLHLPLAALSLYGFVLGHTRGASKGHSEG